MSSTCPECEGSPDLPQGERCYLCNTKSKRIDEPHRGAATAPKAAGGSSIGTKPGAVGSSPRAKVPVKKRKKKPTRRRSRVPYPRWAKAVAQPVFGIITGGCVIHIASLLIGS